MTLGVLLSDIEQSRKHPFWKSFWHSWMFLFFVTLPFLNIWLDEFSRFNYMFRFQAYLELLLLVTGLAVPLSVAWHLFLGAQSAAWKRLICRGLSGFLIAWLLATVAMLVMNISGFDVFTIAAYKTKAVFGLGLLLSLFQGGLSFFSKVGGVAVKLLTPLPLILLPYFYSVDGLPARLDSMEDLETAGPESIAYGSVYILLFDEFDRSVVLDDENNTDRFKYINGFNQKYTSFPASQSPFKKTRYTLPALLFQTNEKVTYNGDGSIEFRTSQLQDGPCLLDMLAQNNQEKVAVTWYLNANGILAQREDIKIRSYARGYPNNLPVCDRIISIGTNIIEWSAVPIPGKLYGTTEYHLGHFASLTSELERVMFQGIDAKKSVVGFYHFTLPHGPYIYDRNGKMPVQESMVIDEQSGYLKAVDYVDSMLERIEHRLRENGKFDDATIIVMADHGLSEESRNEAMLMIKLPNQKSPRTVSRTFVSTDLAEWLWQQPEFIKGRVLPKSND